MLLELLRDYRDVLPEVDVPTLVCAGADEKWRSVASARYVAELLPDADSNASRRAATARRSKNRSGSTEC